MACGILVRQPGIEPNPYPLDHQGSPMVLYFKCQIPVVHWRYIGKQLIFIYQSYIIQLYYNHVLIPGGCFVVVVSFLLVLFCQFFGIFYIDNQVICEQRQFNFFFPDLYIFISLSCFISLAETSSTILKRNGERGHPCLVPGLGESIQFCNKSVDKFGKYCHLNNIESNNQ